MSKIFATGFIRVDGVDRSIGVCDECSEKLSDPHIDLSRSRVKRVLNKAK